MIFEEQISRKPDYYPWTQDFIHALYSGFWTDREFSFSSDIQDFKVNLADEEREIIVRALATIGQLETSLKKFWACLGNMLPHPSIFDLGYVMANTEVIHGNAYERLLEVLGIDDIFEKILELDIIKGRVNYLRKHLHKYHADNRKQFVYSIILFTLFVENISLFSQFYTINWFGRYKNLLKDTNKQVEYTSREECFVEGTEVLTPNGWVDLRSINEGDDVVQYCPDGTFEFSKVLRKTEKPYSGDIYSFYRSGNLCSVTPEHDMVFFDIKNNFRKKKAKDFKTNSERFIPISAVLNNNDGFVNELSFEDRLKIAIQADGSNGWWTNKKGERLHRGANNGFTHYINIKRPRKVERLEWILKNANIKYSKKEPNERGQIQFLIYFNHDFNYKSFDWVDLKNKSSKWCQEFVDEVIEWDGFKRSDTKAVGYTSTNKSCIDKVQTIAIFAGYATSFYANVKKGYESTPCYKLSLRKVEKIPMANGVKKSVSNYEGNVYCVTVPSGVIMTRLNGKTFIAGNCLHAMIGTKLINVIREEHPELFDEELKEKIVKESTAAVKYECEIVDWILGGYNQNKLNSEIVREFIKNRMNDSLVEIGYEPIFEVNKELVKETEWFDEQLLGNNATDFFHGRPTEYSKKNKNFDDIF